MRCQVCRQPMRKMGKDPDGNYKWYCPVHPEQPRPEPVRKEPRRLKKKRA